ncbi:MAG: translation initiation factor IF-2 subunit alpha [Thermoplasmatota archaeon]
MAYVNELPEEGELVVATVRQVKNFGVIVELDEYPGKEGFIHIAEVASGWVKYIRDHVREGQKVVCKVLGIDERRKNKVVDLSLKAVNEHQKREKIQQWKSEQKAQKLFDILCEDLGISTKEGMERFGIELIQEYGSMYRAFEVSAIKEIALKETGFEGEWIDKFVSIAKDNITPPYVEISGILELSSSEPGGLKDIKESLKRTEEEASKTEEIKASIFYIGAPRFRINIVAPNYKLAEEVLKDSAEIGIGYMHDKGGTGKFIRKG